MSTKFNIDLTKFNIYLMVKEINFGNQFDTSDLAEKFIPYFNTGERIKVRTHFEEIKFGTVGITSGWKPSFLLMHSKRSIGSPDLLSDADTILAVKRGNKYEPIP